VESSAAESKGTAAWETGARIGPYLLVDRIALGGMAEIWAARQTGLAGFERLVVIKRMAEALSGDPDFVAMFLDEARLAAQLTHPNIVHVLDLGEHGGSYFLAMEYLNGENLATVARTGVLQKTPLPPVLAAYVAAQAAAGLSHAHTKAGIDGKPLHVVHRDVSPQNLVLTYDGLVKVVDFGIARAANRAALTTGNALKGKLGYMSPEQAMGRELDARSDVFALGIVLHEALTSKRLFLFDDFPAARAGICEGPPPSPPSADNADVPADLDAIVLRALARPVDERYPSARELESDLLAWLKRQPHTPAASDLAAYMGTLFEARINERAAAMEAARTGSLTAHLPTRLLVSTPRGMPGGTDRTFVPGTVVQSAATVVLPPVPLSPTVVVPGASTAVLSNRGRPLFTTVPLPEDPPAPPPMRVPWQRIAVAGVVLWSVAGLSAYVKWGRTPQETPREVATVAAVPLPAAMPAKTEVPAPTAAPAVAPAKTHGDRPRAGGRLSMTTSPWTRVYLGSRLLGDTPLVEVPVPSGTLELRVVNEDAAIKNVVQVQVDPGKVTVKKLHF
jgi:hypothetical protein